MPFANHENPTHTTSHDNTLTGTGHSSLPGGHSTAGHTRPEDGGAVDAFLPNKGDGTHLPNTSGHTSTKDSANPFSHDHQATQQPLGSHGSSGLTGSHTHRPEDGGVVDALNPNRGHESQIPGSTGSTTHTGATHSNNPLSSSSGPHVGHSGAAATETKSPLGNKDGTNAVQTPLNASAAKNLPADAHHTGASTGHSATHGTGTTHGAAAGTGSHDPAHPSKVSAADKIKGSIATVVGKVTKNPEKVAEGEALKTGHAAHGGAHASSTAAPGSQVGGTHSTSTGAGHTAPGAHSNVDNVHHDKHAGFAKEHTSNEGAGTLAGTGTGL